MTQHTPEPRCSNCQWVHEADSEKGTSFRGVKLCPLHAAAPELLEALAEINALTFALGGSSHSTTLDRITTIIARTIAKATQGE